MANKHDGWDYVSTHCTHTGKPCAPGVALAHSLARGIDLGGPTITESFQLNGRAKFTECGHECPLTFRVARRAAWVLGGIADGSDADALVRFAEGFFGEGPGIEALPAGYPAAMVRASR
ncbi:MAG: hypothetical protein U1F30_02525 [Steroidobacteraceae bacterium]